jgi:hypothetical protein
VESGDVSGIYYTSGNNYGASGVTSNYGYKSGDQMGTGQQTYTMGTNYVIYAYGEGATLGNTIAPSAIASAEAFGTQKLNLKLAPSGIASAESIGSLSVAFRLLPVALPSAEAFGSPVLVTNLVISPSGIASAGALGTPTLVYHQYLLPTSLASVEVFGTASLSVGCCLLPVALPSLQAFGAATIARFAYHVILDARFVATSPPANRIYVIGRDANGNPVFGTAVDTTELGLVGERLDFQLEHSVPTTANAASVASAMIAKRRLQKNAGFIRIPPNAGAELWDVVSITDAPTAQAGSLYRVTGIRFNYQLARPTPELSHTLLLSAI